MGVVGCLRVTVVPLTTAHRARHGIGGSHRDWEGAPSARHLTEAYRVYVAGKVTQRAGMHRRSNVPVIS